MTVSKSERIVNLMICLLSTRRFLSRSEIQAAVDGYAEESEAFERTFERDKDELRALGVPIQTGSNDRYFDDERGYRILPQEYELPPVELTAEEMSIVGLAAQAFDSAGIRESSQAVLAKLRAAGVDVDQPVASGIAPHVAAREPAFGPLWSATVDRVRVGFSYPDRETGELVRRQVEPWSIVSRRGAWYLIGYDRDRRARRVFKLSRMHQVRPSGRSGAYRVPEDADLHRVLETELASDRTAHLAIRPGRAPQLRRRAESVEAAAAAQASSEDDRNTNETRERVEVRYGDTAAMVAEIAGYGADILVLGPPDLRSRVIDRLTETARVQP